MRERIWKRNGRRRAPFVVVSLAVCALFLGAFTTGAAADETLEVYKSANGVTDNGGSSYTVTETGFIRTAPAKTLDKNGTGALYMEFAMTENVEVGTLKGWNGWIGVFVGPSSVDANYPFLGAAGVPMTDARGMIYNIGGAGMWAAGAVAEIEDGPRMAELFPAGTKRYEYRLMYAASGLYRMERRAEGETDYAVIEERVFTGVNTNASLSLGFEKTPATNVRFTVSDVRSYYGTFDGVPPTIVCSLAASQDAAAPDYDFTLSVSDNLSAPADIALEVSVNDRPLTGVDGAYSVTLTEGLNVVTVKATDEWGNVARETYTIVYDLLAPVITTDLKDGTVLTDARLKFTASANDSVDGELAVTVSLRGRAQTGKGTFTVALAEGKNELILAAQDARGHNNTATYVYWLDSTGPVIATDLTDGETDARSVRFQAQGKDGTDGADVTVTVNGEKILPSGGFYEAALQPGENTVVFEAADASGNRSRVTRTIFVKTAEKSGCSSSAAGGSITLAAAAAAAGLLLLFGRKKKCVKR